MNDYNHILNNWVCGYSMRFSDQKSGGFIGGYAVTNPIRANLPFFQQFDIFHFQMRVSSLPQSYQELW